MNGDLPDRKLKHQVRSRCFTAALSGTGDSAVLAQVVVVLLAPLFAAYFGRALVRWVMPHFGLWLYLRPPISR